MDLWNIQAAGGQPGTSLAIVSAKKVLQNVLPRLLDDHCELQSRSVYFWAEDWSSARTS